MAIFHLCIGNAVKLTGCITVILFLNGYSFAQCPTSERIGNELMAIEKDASLPLQKYKNVLVLKNKFDACRLTQDTVYARIMNRLGFYEFKANNSIPTNASVNYTLTAISINRSAKKAGSINYAINCYKNLGYYYKILALYNKALEYFDSTLLLSAGSEARTAEVLPLRLDKVSIYFARQDYQKVIDESTSGLLDSQKFGDSLLMMRFLSQRAQSYYFLGQLKKASLDADRSLIFATSLLDTFELASNYKIRALICAASGQFLKARSFFQTAIKLRFTTGDNTQIADDFTDYGNFYLNNLKDFSNAVKNYQKTIEFAGKINDVERLAKAHLNLGAVSFYKRDFLKALEYNNIALGDYNVGGNTANYRINPASDKIALISNKELLLFIFNNKTEILINLYKLTNNSAYLSASLQTALLMDTLITRVRFEQAGELSKLYWRNKTREFFTNALEACHLAKDPRLAFFFMEKSKAVLLNDKLNELGAATHLPGGEAKTEQDLQIEITSAQQKLALLTSNSPAYETQHLMVLQAQSKLERYIRSLERKYPSYYQYKYADKGVTITELQQYLSGRQQSFVHYFMNDTLVYMLGVEPNNSRLIKLSKRDFNYEEISAFNKYCGDKPSLLNEYRSFALLSNDLYKVLFQPLQITNARVIICPDNFIIPFEALCRDKEGKHFLINDYSFSYVYSARYLFNNLKPPTTGGVFIGYAPVSFQSYLNVADLRQSGAFMEKVANNYENNELFIGKKATKNNFIRSVGNYRIVNIFSHALADSIGDEPVLYMQDSVIHLSELQVLAPAVSDLVVLSACQTNVGRHAAGEGIYSLARGFASVGIPCVAATLWNADEQSIYVISDLFHKYLSKGMPKDNALKNAKEDFIKMNRNSEKSLPFYWASMIVIGDVRPVELSNSPRLWSIGMIGAVLASIGIVLSIFIWRRKRSSL